MNKATTHAGRKLLLLLEGRHDDNQLDMTRGFDLETCSIACKSLWV